MNDNEIEYEDVTFCDELFWGIHGNKNPDLTENITKPETVYETPDLDIILLKNKVEDLEDRLENLEELVSWLSSLY